jgi:uncharacterized repeat protein (TIGR03803 family)
VLHSFGNGTDGATPQGSLIFDAAGNLYGTTYSGGSAYEFGGTVFELSPAEGSGWTETVLHSFSNNLIDGLNPSPGSLIFDAAGNLYGTTNNGGSYAIEGGIVFELSPSLSGIWTETILHTFGNGSDGRYPNAGVIFDAAGNLYGTTVMGGTAYYYGGTVFELSPGASGVWAETILRSFGNSGTDPYSPFGGVIFDFDGSLYGTTAGGGYGWGTVFELSPSASGNWKLKMLHGFGKGTDGSEPNAGVIFDDAGNLYGTTLYGGSYGGNESGGIVFELSPTAGSAWTEKVLHNFGNGKDGDIPNFGSLIFDAAGNLYGATKSGGAYYAGTVFKIMR